MQQKSHPYHLVDLSPWPILTSLAIFVFACGAIMLMHDYNFATAIFSSGIIGILLCAYCWWSDVVKEGMVEKQHTNEVREGLRLGMVLFILSEIMFFFVFFWSFFKAFLAPSDILDGAWPIAEGVWPPAGIITFDPWDLPLINTLILLLSGTTCTWAHHAILEDNQKDSVTALGLTVFLGVFFTCFQAYEYSHAAFGLSDGIYPSNFFLTTGFHGIHVIVGTIFLAVCFVRAKRGHFKKGNGHLGFEFAAWYWHFVDVVWLFLFVFVYILGG